MRWRRASRARNRLQPNTFRTRVSIARSSEGGHTRVLPQVDGIREWRALDSPMRVCQTRREVAMGSWSRACGVVLGVCLSVSIPAAAAPDDAARASAEEWLKQRDAGNYDACWIQSARYYREQVTKSQSTKEQWRDGNARWQLYLGKTLSRKVKSVEYMDRLPLPDLPPGKHAVVTFDTMFERTGAMTETVTLMLEDGVWRVTANR